jgi:hypothetical protein
MSGRGALVMAALLQAAGCGDGDPAPPSLSEARAPEVLFLVGNEVHVIALDGTRRRSLGRVGDDRRRTGWPRFLPDGRVAVLGDDTGAIFPYVSSREGGVFQRLTSMNVALHDSLCGVSVDGKPRLVLTITPFLPTRGSLARLDVDDAQLHMLHHEGDGVLLNPAPYSDGRVVVSRITHGTSTIEILDVSGGPWGRPQSQVLATVEWPHLATSPARLPDGRVVFIKVDPISVTEALVGRMMVIGVDGTLSATDLTGVSALEVVGDRVVYEAGGANHVSDLIVTDLDGPPVNLTNTPYVSEHIGWSD